MGLSEMGAKAQVGTESLGDQASRGGWAVKGRLGKRLPLFSEVALETLKAALPWGQPKRPEGWEMR